MLAFLLVFVAIAAMQFFLPKPKPQPEKTAEQQKEQQQQQQQQQVSPATPVTTDIPTKPASRAVAQAAAKLPAKQGTAVAESVLENDYYRITFTNQGALVKSWVLKKYHDDKGKPLDLVNDASAPTLGYPLSFFSYDKDLEKKLNESLYVMTVTGPSSAPEAITFEYSDGEISARKTFRPEKMYVIDFDTQVTRNGQGITALPQWPAGLGDQASLGSFSQARIDWDQNGNIERKSPTSGNFITGRKWIANGQTVNGPFDWVAIVDQYFTVALMPDSPAGTTLVTQHNQVDVPRSPANPNVKDKVSVLGAAFGHTNGTTHQRVFAGPKAVDLLEATQARAGGPDLRGILDFGTFGFISKPLFLWLKWTHEHWIPNWGWAIAFLTLVITMALLPLRVSSMKSSLKMAKIQPQIKGITEKYKRYSITDPRRADMQKEMSELYKREGVNPVGGCFPMLLQMPFLFAFYSMLGNAIELRQANFLWIRDLSAPDPWHLLPILIIITMFLTQRSTPQTGMDPAQQKMMNLMGPLMIGVISWSVASGLCVYWAISNLLGFVQQFFINRSELGQQVRKSRERRTSRKK